MTTANDADRTPPPTADAPSPNGAATLRDRVRSLRLSERGAGGKGASFTALVLPWGLCLILAGVAAAFGYYAYAIAPTRSAADAKAQADDEAKGPKDGSPSALTTDVASSGEVALEAKGYIIPVHQVQVSPKVSGMLIKISDRLKEGAPFHEGEELARIEDVNYQRQLEHATAAHKAATHRKVQAQATLKQKQLALSRDVSAGSGTTADALDKDRTDVEVALAALDAAEADESAADADEKLAQWNVGNCVITAPVTGTILKKGAEKGNIVNPIAFNISSSLCDMADLSDLEVELKIQERDIPKVEEEQPCVAMPEAYQGDPKFLKTHPKGYTGKVSRLMPTADRGQGAIPVRVKLDIPKEEEGKFLKPDMGVIVEFLKGAPK